MITRCQYLGRNGLTRYPRTYRHCTYSTCKLCNQKRLVHPTWCSVLYRHVSYTKLLSCEYVLKTVLKCWSIVMLGRVNAWQKKKTRYIEVPLQLWMSCASYRFDLTNCLHVDENQLIITAEKWNKNILPLKIQTGAAKITTDLWRVLSTPGDCSVAIPHAQ